MCSQPPCMNIAVRMVIQCRPATISAGITDHFCTNGSPPVSSKTKTNAFTAMIAVVMTGERLGRREASPNGIIPPTLSSSDRWTAPQARQSAPADILVYAGPHRTPLGRLSQCIRQLPPRMKEPRLGQARWNAEHPARFRRGKTVYSTESICLLQFRRELTDLPFDKRLDLFRGIDFFRVGPWIHGSA